MKLGVITDGISDGVNRDLEHALRVMTEAGLQHGHHLPSMVRQRRIPSASRPSASSQ